MERLSDSERSEVWDRWEAGESQRSISRRLGRSPSTIRTHLLSSGFRRPLPGPEWSNTHSLIGGLNQSHHPAGHQVSGFSFR